MKNPLTNKAGVTRWELTLFAVFLSVAFGATVFFFFLGSHDVKTANKSYAWLLQVNDKLDYVCEQIANSAKIVHPFCQTSAECFFESFEDADLLVLSPHQEGFVFKDGKLFYAAKPKQNEGQEALAGGVFKPIIENCQSLSFSRLGPNLIELKLEVKQSFNDKAAPFRRLIKLRN